ncbi:MAG: Gfo/Idh/MocA family oxidoreductase [Rhodothermaceae bacterium]|nr:Gfo/Idh/MocA family oxidoreductase [Bacteroidota bacterium]MXW15458.1 Gfo/Idh/MocA family oxidoreductase [Rhodothermaceae bacterium]MDE2645191.1 Gfo/Idh/MocA family oxidoreductase [Bacteroidota bacterium]MXX96945.1 Gfo/Idh/MocA family oxidoreductase [Rhodothermaceae bacterium]MXZ16744.1 Gfo/Idh/MocA family oxidoreductase [Rhodothermaceae bacterium]
MGLDRKLRYGMVGGGPGAFIGNVHRIAAALDGTMELVAGAFSSDPAKSKAQGKELGLTEERSYASFLEMVEREAARDDRIDFVSIVTPNHIHFPVAKAFLEAGFHVICDKPMTNTLEDAEALCHLVRKHNRVFALTHNYTGYPMIKQARAMIREGKVGAVRKIIVEYPQGWLATPLELTGNKQADWRTDPSRAGAGALGDIGSHAENLARYVTGLELEELCADVTTFVEGRVIDDDVNMLVRYQGGARGVLHASQVSVGEENNLNIRVHGETGSLQWFQEHPNWLYYRDLDGPEQVFKRGNDYLSAAAQHNSRLPWGHPEAFLEAFANIYLNAGRTIAAHEAGEDPAPQDLDFPNVYDGARGVHFILTALESGRRREWVDASYTPPD